MFKSRKILLSIAAVGTAASIAGLGTYANFTATAPVVQGAIATGTISITVPGAGPTNRLTIGATNLVPGDTLQRRVQLTNPSGSINLASLTLTTTGTGGTLLTSDTTNGLQVRIQRCAGTVGWTESVSAPYTYTCDTIAAGNNLGTRSDVLSSSGLPIIQTTAPLTGMLALTNGGVDDMVVTETLPTTATAPTFNALSTAITYTFNATQRAAAPQ